MSKQSFLLVTIAIGVLVLASCKDSGNEPPKVEGGVHLTIDGGSITPTSMTLVWSRSAAPLFQSYEVYFAGFQTFVPSASTRYAVITQPNDTSVVVTNLFPSSRYYFIVRLVTSDGKFADSNEETARTADLPSIETVVRFIHASSSLSTLVVKVDGNTIDTLSLFDYSPYRTYYAAVHTISIFRDSVKIDSGSIAFLANVKASVFILDKQTSTASRFSYREERFTFAQATLPDSILIRFVNASLSLATAALHNGSPGGQRLGGDVAFGRASSYIHLPGGNYSFFLTRAGDTTAVKASSIFGLPINQRYTVASIDSPTTTRLKLYVDD